MNRSVRVPAFQASTLVYHIFPALRPGLLTAASSRLLIPFAFEPEKSPGCSCGYPSSALHDLVVTGTSRLILEARKGRQ